MATFTKLKSGNWKVEIRRKGWPNTYKTFRLKRDAEDWARTIEDDMVRGIYVPKGKAEKLSIADAFDRYLREVTPIKKDRTQEREIGRIKFLKSHLGQYSMVNLNSEIVASFRDDRLNEGKSNDTVRLELSLLSHLYSVAILEWGIGLTVNPVINVRKPNPGQGRGRRLENDEEERLIKACNQHANPFLGWIVRLALATAMRKSEIISLTREQVSLKKKTILLANTKNNSARLVPLTGSGLKTITEAMEHGPCPDDTNLIFYSELRKNEDRKPYTIDKAWWHALKRAEMADFRFHDLRHEATSRLVEAGLSDQEVASITGHKSMQMLKRYTHLRNESLVEKLTKL